MISKLTDTKDKKVTVVFTLILGGPQSDNNTRFCIFCIETKPWYYTIAGEKRIRKRKKENCALAIDLPVCTTNLFWDKPLKDNIDSRSNSFMKRSHFCKYSTISMDFPTNFQP